LLHNTATYASLLALPTSQPIKAPDLQFASRPGGLVGRLAEVIEASVSDHARPLVILVRCLQVQQARARTAQRRSRAEHGSILVRANAVQWVIDAVELQARCGMLLAYARGDAETPAAPISSGYLKKTLSEVLIDDPAITELTESIERRAAVDQDWPAA
jgi:hypothetical protein